MRQSRDSLASASVERATLVRKPMWYTLPPTAPGQLGKPGFEFLDLTGPGAPKFESPPIPSHAGQISEDPLIDPVSTPPLLLSPAEGIYCAPGYSCVPNYEIADITDTRNPVFYQNQFPGQNPIGFPDSAGADCNAGIALATMEPNMSLPAVSTPYIADFNHLDLINPWTAPSQFFPLTGSYLGTGEPSPGPIAVAQSTNHLGVLGEEAGGQYTGNAITAFQLNLPPWSLNNPPFANWVTCNLGADNGVTFSQGFDPHTITAYQSKNSPYHSFAVIANAAPADTLAVVDLDQFVLLPSTISPHICDVGTITQPSTIVKFISLR
jgi:hypothetical protein